MSQVNLKMSENLILKTKKEGFINHLCINFINCKFLVLPIGANALCENNGNAAVCKCPPDNVGDPYVSCTFDPCAQGPCGPNTDCSVSGQRSLCRCIRGFTGSPNSRYFPFFFPNLFLKK